MKSTIFKLTSYYKSLDLGLCEELYEEYGELANDNTYC